ncbi:MAG: Nif11-like leader peptide family natural product precursor [Arenicellales bacterium]
MYTLRSALIGAACILSIAAVPAFAASGDESGTGGTSYGYSPMMGGRWGGMMGSGPGWMAGRGYSSSSRADLSDDYLDRLGDRIAERYQLMQRIASEKDKAARRDLVRQYVKAAHGPHWQARSHGCDAPLSRGAMPYGPMGYRMMRPWTMGYGPMGYGMMGPGMMGYGPMGYGMMGPGMMGYGPMGYGMMGPGMMGYGPMGYGRMHGSTVDPGLARQMTPETSPDQSSDAYSDEQIDRISQQMADNEEFRQKLAQTTDKAEREKLIREHLKDMREFLDKLYQAP